MRKNPYAISIASVLLSFWGALSPLFAYAQTPQTAPPATSYGGLPLVCNTLDTDLRIGAVDLVDGGPVSALQDFLYAQGYYPHPAVGEFGWLTFQSVQQFQSEHGIPATGFFGPITRAYILINACATNVEQNVNTILAGAKVETPAVSPATTTPEESSNKTASNTPPIPLPYQGPAFLNWKGTWGFANVATTSPNFLVNDLLLRATGSTTGAMATLPGSEQWTDYSYTASVIANANGGFSLIARYTDTNNFIACTFNGPYVAINQTLNGKRTQVASAHLKVPPLPSVYVSTNARIDVKGNHISCSATGAEDLGYDVTDSTLLKGGIGVSIWYSVLGVSTLDLQSVKVTPL